MSRLLDPTRTIAVILGAHDWTRAGLPKAPSFRRSAAHFQRYLTTRAPLGLGLEPDSVLYLFDDPSPASDQLGRIRDTILSLVDERRHRDNAIQDLLLYYVGHGSCEQGKELHLLIRDSAHGMEEQSSIGTRSLASVLRVAAPQQRRIVILDCCFSEAAVEAFGAMGPLDEAVAAAALKDLQAEPPSPKRGTLLLCSSPRNRTSIGVPTDQHTLFSGALLKVLETGSPTPSPMFSFSALRDEIYAQMLIDHQATPPRPALHQPDQPFGDLLNLPAFPNVSSNRQQHHTTVAATLEEPLREATTPNDHQGRARIFLFLATLLTLIVLIVFVQLKRPGHPALPTDIQPRQVTTVVKDISKKNDSIKADRELKPSTPESPIDQHTERTQARPPSGDPLKTVRTGTVGVKSTPDNPDQYKLRLAAVLRTLKDRRNQLKQQLSQNELLPYTFLPQQIEYKKCSLSLTLSAIETVETAQADPSRSAVRHVTQVLESLGAKEQDCPGAGF